MPPVSTLILIIVIIALVLVAVAALAWWRGWLRRCWQGVQFWWRTRRTHRERYVEKKRLKEKTPNARIIVERTRKSVLRYLRPEFIPAGSFERFYNGQWVHLLGLAMPDSTHNHCWFWPILPLEAEEDKSPIDLYTALNCTAEVEETYGLSAQTTRIIKYIIYAVMIGVGMFLIMLLATAAQGKVS